MGYTLDFLLNYCADSNINIEDLAQENEIGIIVHDELQSELDSYHDHLNDAYEEEQVNKLAKTKDIDIKNMTKEEFKSYILGD